MPMDFQILDADYEVINDSNPVIRLFGRGADGKSVCCFVPDFEPYFYLKASGDLHAVARLIKDTFAQVKKVEIVEKFEPIGYQKTKKEMLRVTTHLPRDVPEIRGDILKLQEVMRAEGKWEVYETDILFRNRFLIDKNLGGMVWLSLFCTVGCKTYWTQSPIANKGTLSCSSWWRTESLRIDPNALQKPFNQCQFKTQSEAPLHQLDPAAFTLNRSQSPHHALLSHGVLHKRAVQYPSSCSRTEHEETLPRCLIFSKRCQI